MKMHMVKHDAAHNLDPALAAQREFEKGNNGRYFKKWEVKKRNPVALRAATRTWAEALAKAWNGGRNVVVISQMNIGVAASQHGGESGVDRIWIDEKLLEPKTAKDLAALVGIIAHELGHLRFTPKTTDRFTTEIQTRGLWQTFNSIEDGKEESKLIHVRPGYEKYLKYAVLMHLLATIRPETIQNIYPLVAGRTYLPQQLRDKMRLFACMGYGTDVIDEFDNLLGDFMRVNPLEDIQDAVDIVQAIHDLFPKMSSGCGTAPQEGETEEAPEGWDPDQAAPERKKSKSKDKKQSESEDDPTGGSNSEDEHDESKDNSEAGGGEEGEDESEDDGDGGKGQDGKGDEAGESGSDPKPGASGEADGEDGESESWDPMEGYEKPDLSNSEAKDKESSQSTGKHVGHGGKQPGDDGPVEIPQEQAKQALDKIRALSEVMAEALAEDYEEDIELIKSEAFGDGNIRRPLSAEIDAQRRMLAALKQLAEKAKGGLDRRKPKGRLNTGRFIRNKDRFDVERITFDKFRPNAADALDMEVVVSADNSGSIHGHEFAMSGALWGLVTALEAVGGPSVTVILWNSDFRIIKVPSDKWKTKYVPTVDSMGGTSPQPMLQYVGSLFKHSRKKQKMHFILTDGAWGGMDSAQKLILDQKSKYQVDTYIIGFNGFNPDNIELYGATDSSGGGLESAADFIFKVCEDRMKSQLAARL